MQMVAMSDSQSAERWAGPKAAYSVDLSVDSMAE